MHKINPEMDIVALVLKAVRNAKPGDEFCKSLEFQYAERGGLSKKQLTGLLGKAEKIPGISPSWLATLAAIIKKKPEKERSPASAVKQALPPDTASGPMIEEILASYPQHKSVLVMKSNFRKTAQLSAEDKAQLQKFYLLLVGKKNESAP